MQRGGRPGNWVQEFKSFLAASQLIPPENVSRYILSRIHRELNPSPNAVAFKILTLHLIVGVVMTAFCPQLGVGPLFGEMGLMHFFMHFGEVFCAIACGAMLLAGGIGVALLVLTREESRVARRYGFLNILLLVAVSFTILLLTGGTADRLTYALWVIGALAGGSITLGLGSYLRLHERPVSHGNLRLG